MRKLHIYVEGQTEERFVKELLQPQLNRFGIFPIPFLATTKVVKSGPNFKGGLPSYAKVKEEIRRLLRDSSAVAVTTMLDYYGLPRTFPGRSSPRGSNCYEWVSHVENEIQRDIGSEKFIPFLTLHEFEGLLFSSPDGIASALPPGRSLLASFQNIRRQFRSPEEINDDPNTAPHARILAYYSGYRKPVHGIVIASRIGLDTIRQECQHFSQWLERLESL